MDKGCGVMRLSELIPELEALKLPHHVCEDGWYSCPKSGECYNDSVDTSRCNCGADEHNQKVDELIQKLSTINN